jgi:hypothetical protein
MARNRLAASFGVVVMTSLAGPAISAADGDLLHERFAVSLGTFFMSSDTRVRADRFESIELGTAFDLEDTFGFDDESVFRADAMWRVFPRHKLRLMYFDSDRIAHDRIEREIRFGDETFAANLDVTADFEFDILEFAYEYELFRHDRYELGVSLGVHNAGLELGLSATLGSSVGGGTISRDERVKTDAPLPVAGVRGTWRLAHNLYLRGHAQYFKLKFGDYDGDIQDYELGVLWQFSRHVGAGVAYNAFQTAVDAQDPNNFEGRLRWEYQGAQIFVRASF